MKKRILSLLLAAVLLLSLFPAVALETYAVEDNSETSEAVFPSNTPSYAEEAASQNVVEETAPPAEPTMPVPSPAPSVPEADLADEDTSMSLAERLEREPKRSPDQPDMNIVIGPCESAQELSLADVTVFTTMEDAVACLRACMVAREVSCAFALTVSEAPTVQEFYAMATKHTGRPKEGDYLRSCVTSCNASIEKAEDPAESTWIYQFSITYITTAEQEALVDAAVENALTKIRRSCTDNTLLDIFLLTDAIPYDTYTLTTDPTEQYKQTAYGALVRGTSVCEGKAVAFYRLALECGLTDCRIAAGYVGSSPGTHGELHAWNILRRNTDEDYYFVDPTWSVYMAVNDPIYEIFNDMVICQSLNVRGLRSSVGLQRNKGECKLPQAQWLPMRTSIHYTHIGKTL